MGWIVKDDQSSMPKIREEIDGRSSDEINEKKSDSLSYAEEVTFRERWRERLVRWSQRVNPFYVEDPPPVPDSDAGLIPEVTANWFSKLTFAWLGPLMLVMNSPPASSARPTDPGKERISAAAAEGRSLAL